MTQEQSRNKSLRVVLDKYFTDLEVMEGQKIGKAACLSAILSHGLMLNSQWNQSPTQNTSNSKVRAK